MRSAAGHFGFLVVSAGAEPLPAEQFLLRVLAQQTGIALANARNVGEPTWLAPILLDYGSWLVTCGREDDATPLLAEAREIYGKLGAVRMLALVEAALPAATAVAGT